MAHQQTSLSETLQQVGTIIYAVSLCLNIGSGILTGCCTYLYLSEQSDAFVTALISSVLVGTMTTLALIAFTTTAVRILPQLNSDYQLPGLAMAAAALIAVLAISGTSNGTFLAFQEASSIERERLVSGAEDAFDQAQTSVRTLEQLLPILQTGRETAGRLKDYEVETGTTGAGKGPIYQELLIQETRLQGAENSVRDAAEDAEHKIRSGLQTLASIREAQKDGALSRAERLHLLENGLARLSSIVIELRQQMPLSSLGATADQLRERITLGQYSANPATRRAQEFAVERLHREFEPIGISLAAAVSDLSEVLPGDVPAYRHTSPTALVFAHAGALFWVLAVGYALDILPYLAIGLILLAHRQLDGPPAQPPRERPAPEHFADRPKHRRRLNGSANRPPANR